MQLSYHDIIHDMIMVNKYSEREKYKKTPEYQYSKTISLGPWTSTNLVNDAIHLVFALARYKFVARMLAGKKNVLEAGCGDAFGTPIVAQFVEKLVCIDIDEKIIKSDRKRLKMFKNIKFDVLDIRQEIPKGRFDAVFSIDVIEHIEPEFVNIMIENICACLIEDGVVIIGTPNITAEKYASKQSRDYHVNVHSFESLRSLLSKYFKNVFMFSMNDEVVHTGFAPMAHYIWAVGVGKR